MFISLLIKVKPEIRIYVKHSNQQRATSLSNFVRVYQEPLTLQQILKYRVLWIQLPYKYSQTSMK